MHFRRAILSIVAASSTFVVASPTPTATAAVDPTDEVIALVVDGVGFGHGRGMSQWGAYGWAVNYGRTWQWILDHYYGGTTLGSVSTGARVRVRLVAHDDRAVVGVVSATSTAMWGGVGYRALHARETTTPNRFDIYASTTAACPGATTSGWTRIAAAVAGPVTFTTSANEATAPAADVLGLCATDGSVTHYRGRIQIIKDNAGDNRVVNDVLVESYLRGVVSREVSTSWGNAAGGAGMNALRAQAVAARSYGLSQNRYASSGGYATTCDSTACQAYGGAAKRSSPTGPVSSGGTCESGNATFECANTNQAVADTAGRVRRFSNGTIAATEFSASNGPRTAGGTFPAVDDPGDDVAANPNHRWTRIIDGDVVAAQWGLGTLTSAVTEPDPTTPFVGIWDNRVRLVGTNGTVVVSAWNFRTAFGLRSPGFNISGVTRDVVSSNSMRLIADSVGLSMTESSTSELPALLDGVFTPASYDAAQNRCTTGCGLSGIGAAASVPMGTDLVVVELGYNSPTDNFGARVDAMMQALSDRQVERVAWINLSERSGRSDYVAANQALAAARARWPDLIILDWRTASAGSSNNRSRWFASDNIHLTSTGQAEMARFIRAQLLPLADFPVGSSLFTWDRETGGWAVRSVTDWLFRLRSEGQWSVGYDQVMVGDFDRDGAVDDLFVWENSSGNWVIQSTTEYTPTFRASGNFHRSYDEIVVGDFDGDGFLNDLFIWEYSTGNWVVNSMNAYRPTYRSGGTFSRAYDTMIVGDWDDDGRLDDAFLWDTTSGRWVVHSYTAFRPTYRGGGTWSTLYDRGYAGDWNGDGRIDDLAVWDDQTGNVAVQSWTAFKPTYRGSATFSSTLDDAVAADLDDDGDVNDMLVFDRNARAWQEFHWEGFSPILARAGTWPVAYDAILGGDFG